MYRYRPIYLEKLDLGNLTTNLQYRYPNVSIHISELSTENISLGQDSSLSNIISITIYILLIAIATLMAYVVLMYLRHRYGGSSFIIVHRAPTSSGYLAVSYSYEGIAKILREVFLSIRNKLCKPYCTPREVALKYHPNSILQLFAKVYEDVVYGSKKRDDAEIVVDKVKKYFIENK